MKYAVLFIFIIIFAGCSSDVASSSKDEEACITNFSMFLEDQFGNITEYPSRDTRILNKIENYVVAEFPNSYPEADRKFLKIRSIEYKTVCADKQDDAFAALFDKCLNNYFANSLCVGCSVEYLEERTRYISEIFKTWNCQPVDGIKCALDACEYASNN